ncbi:MAG: ribose 5-phosphate isomerase B [Candidatus Margulisbacteria bacterium]|nr:ribose 5-phosphate isomerase B [Candidatus Margulisiibacteriota bacterium]MBU1616654.1 ribose 5-phosphate isomerase B [Candidatus Margulisiibacteriota bacterium]MBU1867647.1 ribose 5-phosphate isomerase B [Candidatus Margulisiibacteriota bacterium]
MKIALASDHAGFAMKERVKQHFAEKGIEFKDFGANSEESVDYPDYAYPAARAVAKGEFDRGIFVCGSGVGVTIVANKVKGIRAVNANDVYTAKQSREHGDCNVLCLAGKRLPASEAMAIVDAWLETRFSGDERHLRRIRKIDQ